jgi:hypothetical protein
MESRCIDLVAKNLQDREEDFERFMQDPDCDEFNSYGLDFSLVEGDPKNYYRFQLSWGGPSDEIRFYEDGTIEYWYMDWFDGAMITITKKEFAQWLFEFFCIYDLTWEVK